MINNSSEQNFHTKYLKQYILLKILLDNHFTHSYTSSLTEVLSIDRSTLHRSSNQCMHV